MPTLQTTRAALSKQVPTCCVALISALFFLGTQQGSVGQAGQYLTVNVVIDFGIDYAPYFQVTLGNQVLTNSSFGRFEVTTNLQCYSITPLTITLPSPFPPFGGYDGTWGTMGFYYASLGGDCIKVDVQYSGWPDGYFTSGDYMACWPSDFPGDTATFYNSFGYPPLYPWQPETVVYYLQPICSPSMQRTLPAAEYNALVDLFQSTGGSNWLQHAGWLDPNAAQWSGVIVRGTHYDTNGIVTVLGHVDTLSLSQNNLNGNIPASLGNLSALRNLYVPYNHITGSIPASLGSLSQISYLQLAHNSLSGSIPHSLEALTKLNYIDLSYNGLAGDVPDLSANAALRTFNVANNWLTFLPWTQSGTNIAQMLAAGMNLSYTPQNSIAATALWWDPSGSLVGFPLSFAYSVQSAPLPVSTTAKLFWASGTNTANILTNTPVWTDVIPAGFQGLNTNIVPAISLQSPPDGASHLLLVVDPDNLVTGPDPITKTISLPSRQFGVDVSHYQRDGTRSIDWNLLKASGKEFVFVKATEGPDIYDDYYTNNVQSAKLTGFLVGSYHLAHITNSSPTDEAANFLGTAGSFVGANYLPPELDLETDFCNAYHGNLAAWVSSWLQYVEQQTCETPIIYTTKSILLRLDQESTGFTSAHPLWVGDYQCPPDSFSTPTYAGKSWPTWQFKQFASEKTPSPCAPATCQGILGGTADLDSFNGDATALHALTNRLPPLLFSGLGNGPITPPFTGPFFLEINVLGASQITMQASEDLATWADVATLQRTGCKFIFADLQASSHGKRYYRVKP